MRPIPDPIPSDDPTWKADLLLLAKGLVEHHAKPKIVRRYTGVSQREVRALYRLLHDAPPLSGPATQGSAKFFTTAYNSKKGAGTVWNIQGTIFLRIYSEIAKAVSIQANKGWLLLNAFQAYLRMTEKLYQESGIRRLDINTGYSLLVLAGNLSTAEYGEVAIHTCKQCNREYLVDKALELASQRCPFHAMAANHKRLTEQCRQNSLRTGSRVGSAE